MNRINLDFFDGITQEINIIPNGLDLTGATGTFVLRDKAGVALYPESAADISVVPLTLDDDLTFPDGTVIEAGTEVQALNVAPDLSGLSLADPDHLQPQQYRYGIQVNDGWTIQGYWTVWPDSGPARCNNGIIGVCCGSTQLAVAFGSIPGPTGGQGEPGEGQIKYRLISESGSITSADGTVQIAAGGADISVALPTAAELFDTGETKQVWISRQIDDTGSVTLTGDGSELLAGALDPGESFFVRSNGLKLLINA